MPRGVRAERNPLYARPCRCDRPLGCDEHCVRCGRLLSLMPEREASRDRCRSGWTRAAVIQAIRSWADRYGAPPKSLQWASPDRGDEFPSTNAVIRLFGTWKDAIRAAGFTPPAQGRPPKTSHIPDPPSLPDARRAA
jgi:hypothetical protein